MAAIDGIDFHHVYELVRKSALPGRRPRRFPAYIRKTDNRDAADFCRGVAPRFCLAEPNRRDIADGL